METELEALAHDLWGSGRFKEALFLASVKSELHRLRAIAAAAERANSNIDDAEAWIKRKLTACEHRAEKAEQAVRGLLAAAQAMIETIDVWVRIFPDTFQAGRPTAPVAPQQAEAYRRRKEAIAQATKKA